MTVKWTNNATSAIADVTFAADGTILNITPGTGALFPTLGVGDVCYITLVDTSGNREIVKATARDTDQFTVVRAQEGTTARAFAQDDKVELRPTAGIFDFFVQKLLVAAPGNIPVWGTDGHLEDGLALGDVVSPRYFERARFAYSAVTTVTIGPGRYTHMGTTTQSVYWASTLTFVAGPAGSNADSHAMPTSGKVYFYIDDSAVVAAATNVLTESEIIAKTTAPTWTDAKGAQYDGNDRFLFALPTNASAEFYRFIHDGGNYVKITPNIEVRELAALADTANVTLPIPDFGADAMAECTFRIRWVSANASFYWRQGGTTHSHIIGRVYENSVDQTAPHTVFVNDSQRIQLYAGNAGGEIAAYLNGFYLPMGA